MGLKRKFSSLSKMAPSITRTLRLNRLIANMSRYLQSHFRNSQVEFRLSVSSTGS